MGLLGIWAGEMREGSRAPEGRGMQQSSGHAGRRGMWSEVEYGQLRELGSVGDAKRLHSPRLEKAACSNKDPGRAAKSERYSVCTQPPHTPLHTVSHLCITYKLNTMYRFCGQLLEHRKFKFAFWNFLEFWDIYDSVGRIQ